VSAPAGKGARGGGGHHAGFEEKVSPALAAFAAKGGGHKKKKKKKFSIFGGGGGGGGGWGSAWKKAVKKIHKGKTIDALKAAGHGADGRALPGGGAAGAAAPSAAQARGLERTHSQHHMLMPSASALAVASPRLARHDSRRRPADRAPTAAQARGLERHHSEHHMLMPAPAPAPAPMPPVKEAAGDWEEFADPETGDAYYYSKSRGETVWDRPPEMDAAKGAAAAAAAAATTTAVVAAAARKKKKKKKEEKRRKGTLVGTSDWEQFSDPSSGETYFYSKSRGLTRWDRPPEMDAAGMKGRKGTMTAADAAAASVSAKKKEKKKRSNKAGDWQKFSDPDTGDAYYYSKSRGQTVWDKPDDFDDGSPARNARGTVELRGT